MRRKIFRQLVDDRSFAAFVGLRDKIDVAFVFDFRRARIFFAEDFAGFACGLNRDLEISF